MFADIVKERRSVRIFTEQPVEREKIDQLIEMALRSPSAKARRPCRLIVVSEKAQIEKLAVAKPQGAGFLKSAPLAVVVCGDPQTSAIWVEDCSIMAVTLQYAATSLGLGSCWAHLRDREHSETVSSTEYVAGLLGLPEGLEVFCILGIGYSAQQTRPYRSDELKYDQVSLERFGQPL